MGFSAEAEKLFKKGLEAYQKERYQKAQDSFQKLLEFPLNQRSSAGQLMLSRTFFRLEDYALALNAAKTLPRKFPDSRYVADARLVAGDSYYMLRRYYEAATQYGRILATPASLALQASAAERLAGIVKNGFISTKALESIRLSIGAERLREALLFGEARWYQRLGWREQSRIAMQVYLDKIPEGIFAPLVEGHLGRDERLDLAAEPVVEKLDKPVEELPIRAVSRPRIGLLLPLSGPYRKYGEDLLAGVQLANQEVGEQFELVVEDKGVEYEDLPIVESEGSELLRTVHATRRLIEEEVVAIIGPVFSSASVAAGVVAEAAGVPLIVPLAYQSGLDSLGQHIFQLNIIPEVQGRALGEYATLVLGLRNLVVLAPLSDYGWNLEREFVEVAHANGGNIVYVDWYVPAETKDFKNFFEAVRQVGFSLMPPPPPPPDTLALAGFDSLAWVEEDSLWMLDEEMLPVSSEVEEEEAPPDSSEIFIDTIDGVLIVVESFEDASTIAPQLRFHRVETQILGNDLWYEPEAIRQLPPGEREYVRGTIFVSGYHESAPATRKFTDVFRSRVGRDPGYAAYGYDAARIVMEGWLQGNQSRSALRRWIADLQGFEGASGIISFLPGRRTNGETMLLKIDARGRVKPLVFEDLPDLTPLEEDLPEPDLPEADLLELDENEVELPTLEE